MKKLETSNKRIVAFYQANPHISFEAINLIFIDIFDKLIHETDKTVQSTIQTQIMSGLTDNAACMSEIKESISALTESMVSIHRENHSMIFSKLADIRKEYIDDVKQVIRLNQHEQLGPILERNNATLLDKTTLLLNDMLPKSQTHIHEQIQQFHQSVSADTAQLLKSVDSNSTKEFLNHFEIKSSIMLQNLQQPIYSYISASEDRILASMNAMKDGGRHVDGNHGTQVLHNNQLSGVLTKMYQSAEISTQTASMPTTGSNILLKRIRKPNILIENKDSPENITVDDIQTFLLHIEDQNCHGIFISQSSGICTKKNYQIEIHGQNIVVFLHNADYSAAKIESAVDIIDHLSCKLRQYKGNGTNDDCIITKDLLDSINTEYQLFLTQKNAVIDVFKESQKKVLSQIDELRFPCLDKYLSTKYTAPVQKPGLKCDMCKCFTANNLKALAAHKRGCARKNIPNIPTTSSSSASSIESTTTTIAA